MILVFVIYGWAGIATRRAADIVGDEMGFRKDEACCYSL